MKNKNLFFKKNTKKNIINNYYSTKYFLTTKKLIKETNKTNIISVLQFFSFSEENIMVTGITETIELINFYLSKKEKELISVFGVEEGDVISPKTPILKIKGPYYLICNLENIIDSILSRRTSVSTNAMNLISELKDNQEIIYMADRNDDFRLMPYDAYSAYKAGIRIFTNNAHLQFIKNDENVKLIGTIPHSLIHQYKNDLKTLIRDFNKHINQKPTLLIDFNNDVIKTLESCKEELENISAIRLDTSSNMVDKSLSKTKENYGINSNLIFLVRNWLDTNNFQKIKIVVSSSISKYKIKEINDLNAPVDFYGIGQHFIKNSVHITADLVKYNDENFAKEGRTEFKNPDNWKQYI